MTAYRYVRTGRLEATRESGNWVVEAPELRRFATVLPSGERSRPEAATPSEARVVHLVRRLVAGDDEGAWALVEEALVGGYEPEEVHLDLLAPALHAIGEAWSTGELSVGDEHRATFVAERIVGRLGPRFSKSGRRGPTVLLAAPEGDRHALPIFFAADLLRARRYRIVALGADAPADEVARLAFETMQDALVAVLLGATTPGNSRAIERTLSAVHRAVPGITTGVGGAAIADEAAALALGADIWTGSDGRSLVAAVESIRRNGQRARA